jgi:hypothetical protein
MPDVSTARLVDPATGTELVSYGGWTPAGILEQLDLGFPAPREVTAPRAGTHGTVDSTRWAGARAITMQVAMPAQPDTDTAVDNLAGLLNPQLRLWLYVQRPGWASERRILVRGATFTCPPGILRKAQAGWVAPNALLEDADESATTLMPSGTGTGGVSMPITMPVTFAGGVISGSAFVNVGGTAPAPVQIDVYGPCSDPMVRCIDTAEQIKFTGITIAAGDFLRIDTANRTAYLNGLTDQSRYNKIDFLSSTWLTLPPGRTSQVVFSPTSPSGNCQAVLTWRARYL